MSSQFMNELLIYEDLLVTASTETYVTTAPKMVATKLSRSNGS